MWTEKKMMKQSSKSGLMTMLMMTWTTKMNQMMPSKSRLSMRSWQWNFGAGE